MALTPAVPSSARQTPHSTQVLLAGTVYNPQVNKKSWWAGSRAPGGQTLCSTGFLSVPLTPTPWAMGILPQGWGAKDLDV